MSDSTNNSNDGRSPERRVPACPQPAPLVANQNCSHDQDPARENCLDQQHNDSGIGSEASTSEDLPSREGRGSIPVTVEFVLQHLARCEEVFQIGRELLLPEHFSGTLSIHSLIWHKILEHYAADGRLPTYNVLSVAVLSAVSV